METRQVWMLHTRELTNNASSRARCCCGHKGQMVRRGPNIHVKRQVGVRHARIALDKRVNSRKSSCRHTSSCQ